ncbi:MAG: methionyl-tRNA formyltransferase [Flavisolibacter sp.]
MSAVKIILLCSSRMALPLIQELAFFQKLAVVGIPLHCQETREEVEMLLKDTGIPILGLRLDDFSEKVRYAMESFQVNLGLVLSFSFKIPKEVYSFPHHGFFNIHPGSLPDYRGPDPVFQQIKNREPYATLTIHHLDEGFDSGPIVMMEKIPLESSDTHGMVTSKLSLLAPLQVRTLIKLAEMGILIPSLTQGASKIRYFKKQLAADVSIDWEKMDGDAIIALINACNPWNKGAVTKLENKFIRLLQAGKVLEHGMSRGSPGSILSFDEGGMLVSSLRGEVLRVSLVYMDEGFYQASSLAEMGIKPGLSFEKI